MSVSLMSGSGYWVPADGESPDATPGGVLAAMDRPDLPVWVVRLGDRLAVGFEGHAQAAATAGAYPLEALLPALYPEWLGDRGFCEDHGVRFPYVAGAMATGIASVDLVCAAARAGFLAYLGTGGLSYERSVAAVDAVERQLADLPGAAWGANLIHSPDQPGLEEALADLYLARGVTRIEASAFM